MCSVFLSRLEVFPLRGKSDKLYLFYRVFVRITSYNVCYTKLLRGGLAHVNIVASMFFAGISGSAVADTAALGSILIPAMEKDGYDTTFSAAVTASSSVSYNFV